MSSGADRLVADRSGIPSGPLTNDEPTGRERDGLIFGLGLALALLPFVVSAITLAIGRRDYQSVFDRAIIELNVRDVGRHAVNIGAYSIGKPWHHPGPALFYVLAVPYRLLGSRGWSLLVGALLVNAAAVAGVGVVARRRGGTAFALAALAGVSILAHALGASFIRDPWNPFILALPLVLLVLLVWSLVERDVWSLPWLAGCASFVVQAHVGTLLPVVVLLVAAAVILVLRRREAAQHQKASLNRPVLVGGLVLLVMWLPPIVDSAMHDGGNLRRLFEYFRDARSEQTLAVGAKVVGAQLTVPPPWFNGHPVHVQIIGSTLAVPRPSIPWLGLLLVVAVAFAVRRGALEAARFGVLVVVVMTAAVVAISRVSGDLTYWFIAYVPGLGVLAALATAYALWGAAFIHGNRPSWLRKGVVALLLLTIAVPGIALAATSADADRVPDDRASRAISAVASATVHAVHGIRRPMLVRFAGDEWTQLPTMVAMLNQRGISAVVDSGDQYDVPASAQRRGRPVGAVLTVAPAALAATYGSAFGKLVAGRPTSVPELPPDLARGKASHSRLTGADSRRLARWFQDALRARAQLVVFLGPPPRARRPQR